MSEQSTLSANIAIYTYDAGGQRILKHNAVSSSIYLNAKKVADSLQTDATLYPSGLVVARGGNGALTYTKHYFAGTQRISSTIGTTENLGEFLFEWLLEENFGGATPIDPVGASHDALANGEAGNNRIFERFGMDTIAYNSDKTFVPVNYFMGNNKEVDKYWFHPDHLGSSNYITNLAGEVSQHMEYFAFGETFVEEHKNSHNAPWKYNGKELDEETGWYYYGARYYNPRTSIWLSVDPLAEKYPHISPYAYVANNPIKFIDPDGQRIVVASQEDRDMLLGFLTKIYGEGNFSFNDNNELQFDGNIKKFKGDSKDTLKELTGVIDADYDVNIKLSNFSDEEKSLLKSNGGAYTAIKTQTNKKGKFEKVLGANIFLNEDGIEDLFLFEKKYRYRDSDGFLQTVSSSRDVPEGISSEIVYAFIYDKDGKPQTVPGGGGSVNIMHEIFHVAFEGKNQRKINRYDNKVRRILEVPERSVDDPQHNYDKK